ncbi:HesA/MoeB/ThiF family protein [Danxiaibacter flavus]|uniref:HesA/MoeB/ThiF family protein n=1 Tax=Danxiaibacter flavus TaxID=3049108 RepID=A0ABV3ZLY4_9BACT|nr:HesA/MoeB/ThiF family protein [Chitinophagaceae bacterium DXS]
MLSQKEQARYQRQLILPEIGVPGQLKLQAAKVLVIGAGGLGCPVLQYLAAAGVGTLGIVDGDVVEESNLQRQILYTSADVSKPKAVVAKARIEQLNPFVTIEAHTVFISSDNALEIIKPYDIVVDGSDNFATRYMVNDACVMLNKPLVFGSIYKFEGQVAVFNYNDGPTYRCLFPEAPNVDEVPNCATIGVVASLPGIIGTIQANEVIKIITQHGEVLSGKLWVMDVATMQTQVLQFSKNPSNKNITHLRQQSAVCSSKGEAISFTRLKEVLENSIVQLVDVREKEEHKIRNIGGLNIPLSTFKDNFQQMDPKITTVLYCAAGVRSRTAMELLVNNGFKEVYSLENGISGINTTANPLFDDV